LLAGLVERSITISTSACRLELSGGTKRSLCATSYFVHFASWQQPVQRGKRCSVAIAAPFAGFFVRRKGRVSTIKTKDRRTRWFGDPRFD
jgi:hypothetical protein